MVTWMFKSQIERTVEAYIDDMVVKCKQVLEHLKDLEYVFSMIRKHGLRLNASKCFFGISSG